MPIARCVALSFVPCWTSIVAPQTVDLGQARLILEKAWSKVDDLRIVAPANVVPMIEAIMASANVTFKYILVTGVLGKRTQPKIHPRALQTGSKLRHSYDARSLCHKVIVTFEKDKGDLWGLSNEPFVNKPARHPEHDRKNPQLRDKEFAAILHDALETVHRASPSEVFAVLVHILRLGKQRSANQVIARADIETTYLRVVRFVERFLEDSDGGTRVAAIVGAFATLLNHGFDVNVYPPNYSDTFAKTAGDVEIMEKKKVVTAFECKHRPLNLDDVRHGIRKAQSAGVAEYCFVCAAGLSAGQENEIRHEISSANASIDVELFKISAVAPAWAAMLNPVRRRDFGELVTRILRTSMHRAEVANKAAELWNSLK